MFLNRLNGTVNVEFVFDESILARILVRYTLSVSLGGIHYKQFIVVYKINVKHCTDLLLLNQLDCFRHYEVSSGTVPRKLVRSVSTENVATGPC